MYRQSPRSKGQRSNKQGLKVKNGLQLILMLGVGVWLFYQTHSSYTLKDKSLGERFNVSERLRLGRKDIPRLGDAETRGRDGGNDRLGDAETRGRDGGNDEVGSKGKENGGDYGFKNKVDDKKEVKEVGNEGMKEDVKARGGEMKGVVRDGKIKNLMFSGYQVQDGSDKDEKENGFAQDARVKESDAAKIESRDNIDAGEDKFANMNSFSDETFASHGQNETDDNLGAKVGKGETGVDSYRPELNVNPTLKIKDSNTVDGGDSATFSDTNGNEAANGVENPGSSSSVTYEEILSEQPDTSHNSLSQEQKSENRKEPSEMNNYQVTKDESSSTIDNANKERYEHVESSNKVSDGQKEDGNGEHNEEVDSTVSDEVKDRTDLDTLPSTDNQTHSKDAVAL